MSDDPTITMIYYMLTPFSDSLSLYITIHGMHLHVRLRQT